MATISQSFPRSPADVSHEITPAARAFSVLDLIGNTPLLEITRLTDGLLRPSVRIFAKLEGFNPGGSVKDRAARKMIELGLARGDFGLNLRADEAGHFQALSLNPFCRDLPDFFGPRLA